MQASDAIMVARGDLGMEIPTEKVFKAQKHMIDKCNATGTPVIVATQMLESMIVNPRPTRAEASDVANAILDGADWVMLSGESANGAFPLESVQIMASIISESESVLKYKKLYDHIVDISPTPVVTTEILAAAWTQAAFSLHVDLIVVMSRNGKIAQMIAKYRPRQPIFACCTSNTMVRQLNLIRGVFGYKIPSFQNATQLLKIVIKAAKSMGLWKTGNTAITLRAVEGEGHDDSTLMEMLEVS